MDLQTTIIGLSISALCVYAFVLLTRSRKKKEKKLINQLRAVALEQACQITEHELGFDFSLGIDNINQYIFYTKENQAGFDNQVIDLKTVRKCEVVSPKKRVAKEEYIDRITLVFHPSIAGAREEKIVLFDSDATALPNGEPLMAKRWAEKVNALLKDRKASTAFRVAV